MSLCLLCLHSSRLSFSTLHPGYTVNGSSLFIQQERAFQHFTQVVQSMEALSSLNKQLILHSDFNAPNIDWSTQSASTITSTMLCDLIFHLNFTQVIIEPTHVKGGILYLLITNIEDHILAINKTLFLSTDHFIITFNTNMTQHSKKTTWYLLDFSKGNLGGLNNHFLDVDFIPALLATTLTTPGNYSSQLFSMHVLSLYPRLDLEPTNLPGGSPASQVVHPSLPGGSP